MEYTADHLKKIISLGTLSYGVEKCVNVLGLEDEEQFREDFRNPETRVYKAYQKGKDIADFAIDTKLFELAKDGDLDALAEFNERKAQRELQDEDDFTEKYS